MMRLIWMSLVLLLVVKANAQIIATFPKENPVLQEQASKEKLIAKERNSQIGLNLPFFDDFSYPGPYPVASHWEDQQVYINNTLANDPVSVGIATFDGLNASGSPYGGGRVGSSDTLTSVGLNLKGLLAAYISYYVQPKGLGDTPEPGSDLVLEFRTIDGEWEEIERHVQSLRSLPIDSVTQFAFVGPIAINESRYLYDGFQFRFRNFSLRNGAVDLWHIDYVRVESQPTSEIVEDLAFTKLPPHIFKNYTSAPWTHFIVPSSELVAEELRFDHELEFFNHSNQAITINDSRIRFLNATFGTEPEVVEDDLFANTSIAPKRQLKDKSILFDYSGRIQNLQANDFIRENNYAIIRTRYLMDPSSQANIKEITRNDTVSTLTRMDDYYAYDDGTAESAIFIVGLGGEAAMQFYNYKSDSLRGFQIQIPRLVAGAANGNITLKVWLEDLNTTPIVELPISPFFLDEFRDTLQAFTTYALKDRTGAPAPVALPPGVFFVGFEQGLCQTSCVPVGLDRNTPQASERVFLNEDGNWKQVSTNEIFSNLKGALMLRPILGEKTPKDSELATDIKELLLDEVMHIFPNPSNGIVNVQLFKGDYANYQLQIHNSLGQLLNQIPLLPQLDLSVYQTGIYFLQFYNSKTREAGHYRIVVK